MRVKYVITEELQEEVKLLLKQTRDSVVKERLIAVSLYVTNCQVSPRCTISKAIS